MILVEQVQGNLAEAMWQQRRETARLDFLALDQWEAQKNRLRKRTQGGVELAISLDRGTHLHDGDVLLWDAAAGLIVATRIALREVMVVDLAVLAAGDPALALRTAVELGHALGNQHWPAVVKDNHVYVPLTVDRKVMASVMKTHAFADVSYDFVPGADVIPYLAPHEARRLFGGAEGPVHTHLPATPATG